MSKTEEIEILRRAANRLGQDSYLGPWLRSIVDEVEQSIRSDILPELTVADAHRKCQEMLSEARKHAAEIVRDANERANRESDRVRQECAAIRKIAQDRVRNDIDNLVYALQDFKNSR